MLEKNLVWRASRRDKGTTSLAVFEVAGVYSMCPGHCYNGRVSKQLNELYL